MRQKINMAILLVLSFMFFNCASFTKKRFRKELKKLNQKELSQITGKYSLNPIRRYYSLGQENPNDKIPDSLTRNNAYYFLTSESYHKKQKFDSLRKDNNKYYLSLALKANNKLKVELLENNKVIEDTVFTGKYRRGMFYIDNKFLECQGIPFVFGGCNNNKRRIGITKNKNLLINEAFSNEGALLLVIGAGYSYNVTYEYKRQ